MECVLKIGTEVPVPCCAEHRRFYVGLNDQEKAEKAAAFLAKQVRMFDE
jgi:L-ribulose-5-phosphate 3-epimerase UlaE